MGKVFFSIALTRAQKKLVRPGVMELVAVDYYAPKDKKVSGSPIKLTKLQKGFISKVTGVDADTLEITWRPVMKQYHLSLENEVMYQCDYWLPEKQKPPTAVMPCDFWDPDAASKRDWLLSCDSWHPDTLKPLASCDSWNPESDALRTCDIWNPDGTGGNARRHCDWWTPETMPNRMKKSVEAKFGKKKK